MKEEGEEEGEEQDGRKIILYKLHFCVFLLLFISLRSRFSFKYPDIQPRNFIRSLLQFLSPVPDAPM
jgi:hypothetical protein